MRRSAEWRAALSMLAASAGVGMASGRAVALFFGQFKAASWAGAAAAAALFGLLAGWMAARQGALSPGRDALSRMRAVLRMLLAALTAALMLERLGRLGALTLPLRHGYGFGAAFGLLAALGAGRLSARGRGAAGFVIAAFAAAFYAACAVDSRPVALREAGAVEFLLAGDYAAALLLAVLFAAMNACAAEWALDRRAAAQLSPPALGVRSAALMGGLLALALCALRRGGDDVMAQPMPWVLLSARWGLPGFWLCAGFEALCAASTLSAALTALLPRGRPGDPPAALSAGMLLLALTQFGMLTAGEASMG